MNKLTLWLVAWIAYTMQAQPTITLAHCYDQTRQNFPLIQQQGLLDQMQMLTLANADKTWLPQVVINAQATYQSDVTKIQLPFALPAGMEMPSLSKDQYKLYVEATQTIYDGGMVKQQKALTEANTNVEKQKIEVELFKLRERVLQLYFGVLLIDENLNQLILIEKDINDNLQKIQAAIEWGTALKLNAQWLQAELIKIKQRRVELQTNRATYLSMLGALMGQPLPVATQLEMPIVPTLQADVTRPELLTWNRQRSTLDVQEKMIFHRNLPRVAAFVQAGYGRPALNMLDNDFKPYAIGGLRASWRIDGFYTRDNDKKLIQINREALQVQQKVFLFNLEIVKNQQLGEIKKLESLLTLDSELIALRQTIKQTIQAQLQNGVATAHDYLRELNAEDQARQALILHQLQLLMAKYMHNNIMGS